jgi:hypothetical protein
VVHTVMHQVNIIRIGQQLQNFQEYQQKLAAFIGDHAAKQLVNQALVLITLGGNDFVNNYYLVPFSVRSRQFAIQDYVPYLTYEYKKILSVISSCLNFRLFFKLCSSFIRSNIIFHSNQKVLARLSVTKKC